MKKNTMLDNQEKIIAENLWLNYLNRYLFEGKVITEKEYKLMTEKIALRDVRCYGAAWRQNTGRGCSSRYLKIPFAVGISIENKGTDVL